MAAIASSYTEQLTGRSRLTYEEFLALPDDIRGEWVDGEVVPMPSVSGNHQELGRFLIRLLSDFLDERPIATLRYDPFQIHLPGGPGRAPDVMILLNEHLDRLRDLYIDGAADLVIEIVSPSGARRDYVEKFREYEAAGVPEYWIIDPENREVSFFLLSEGRYEVAVPGANGRFDSQVLPGFWLNVEWLWERPKVRTLIAEVLGE